MRTVLAPAKVNLCLFLGPTREADHKHELVTVFDALSLADILTVQESDRDEVICPGVEGPNLVGAALAALREAGWDAPPMRVTIEKQIPVAAGMGGGSSDAAAILALARTPDGAIDVHEIAQRLGADISAMIAPGLWMARGAGERLVQIGPALAPHAYVVVPSSLGLSTAEVYREADRLGAPRSSEAMAELDRAVLRALGNGEVFPAQLIVNDLQPAALSLCPSIQDALDALAQAGAEQAIVSGSGPTTVGIWWGDGASEAAERAAKTLAPRFVGVRTALPFASPSQFGQIG